MQRKLNKNIVSNCSKITKIVTRRYKGEIEKLEQIVIEPKDNSTIKRAMGKSKIKYIKVVGKLWK